MKTATRRTFKRPQVGDVYRVPKKRPQAKSARPIRRPASPRRAVAERDKDAISETISAIVREKSESFRAELRKIVEQFGAGARPTSPIDRERARIDYEFREPKTAEHQAMQALTKAEKAVERALAEFMRAADAGQYVESETLLVKHREAELELGVRRKQLAACRAVRERCEGEVLVWSQYA